jgi:hypothetical protein
MRLCLPVAAVAAAAFSLATPAAAQRVDARLSAALDCVKVTDETQRLACYDRAMVPLSEAAASGALQGRSLGPKSLEGKIRAMRGQGVDRLIVQLDNGDRWTLMLEGNERLPRAGDAVTIRRGALGNWWVKVTGRQTFQARFLGPPESRQ